MNANLQLNFSKRNISKYSRMLCKNYCKQHSKNICEIIADNVVKLKDIREKMQNYKEIEIVCMINKTCKRRSEVRNGNDS